MARSHGCASEKAMKNCSFLLNIQRLHSISCHKLIKPIRYGFNDVAEIIEEELKTTHNIQQTLTQHMHKQTLAHSAQRTHTRILSLCLHWKIKRKHM